MVSVRETQEWAALHGKESELRAGARWGCGLTSTGCRLTVTKLKQTQVSQQPSGSQRSPWWQGRSLVNPESQVNKAQSGCVRHKAKHWLTHTRCLSAFWEKQGRPKRRHLAGLVPPARSQQSDPRLQGCTRAELPLSTGTRSPAGVELKSLLVLWYAETNYCAFP